VPELLTRDLRFYETQAGPAAVAPYIPNKRAHNGRATGRSCRPGGLGLLGCLPCSTSMRVQDSYSAGVAFPANCDSCAPHLLGIDGLGGELHEGRACRWRLGRKSFTEGVRPEGVRVARCTLAARDAQL
jgi:hypothetical protein